MEGDCRGRKREKTGLGGDLGRFSTERMTEYVTARLAFWAVVSHFLPGAEFSVFSRGLCPCKGSISTSPFLKSYSLDVHCGLGDALLVKSGCAIMRT